MLILRKYFVVYEKWGGDRTRRVTECIGRHLDDTSAEAAARDYEFRKGIELTDLRRETKLEATLAAVGDALFGPVFRIVRITLAAALALFVYPQFSGMRGISDIPLSQLTLGMLTTAALQVAVVIGLAGLCFWIAFGPSRSTLRR